MWLILLIALTTIALAVAVPRRMRAVESRTWQAAEHALEWAALLLAVLVSAYLTATPFMEGTTVEIFAGSPPQDRVERRSFIESQGIAAIIVLVVPNLASALPLLIRRPRMRQRARIAAALILWITAVLGALSVGLFYAPAALAATAAALLASASRRAT
jgi:hypothetical protein